MHKRIQAFFLAVLIIISLPCTFAYDSSHTLIPGLDYSESFISSDNGGVQLHTFTYKSSGNVSPKIVYGSKLYGRSTLDELRTYMDSSGISPIGAVNGDFFSLTTGIPEGLTITDGVMRSSDSYQNALGITSSGNFFIGTPQLKMTLLSDKGNEISVTYYNKARTSMGVYLLSSDFSSETRINTEGVNILLNRIDGKEVKIGSSLVLSVESIYTTAESEPIPSGYMILTVDKKGPVEAIKNLTKGDILTFSVISKDTRWNEAEYACGAGDMLLKSGSISSNLPKSLKPCTVIGLKNDGTAVFLVIDGRQEWHSVGMSLQSAAEYLHSLGCVDALNLDGGGSSTAIVTYPGTPDFKITNSPSEGSVRKCANYIVFANKSERTGILSGLHLYPSKIYALPGASVSLFCGGSDTAGYYLPIAVTYAASGGILSGDLLTLPDAFGTYTVTAFASGFTGTASVQVIDRVDRIVPSMTNLELSPLEKVKLSADAFFNNREVSSTDSNFTWSCDDVGKIDKNGVFTATRALNRTGTITVSYGDVSSIINVTVSPKAKLIPSDKVIYPSS